MKNIEGIGVFLTVIGTACWGVCFWWMHRISDRQDTMLKELHDVIRRIEELSKEEHALMREVHPVVEKIHSSVETVADAVGGQEGEKRGP